MLATILGLIQSLFSAIPIISKWFTKTAQQKKEQIDAEEQAKEEAMKNTGRP